MRRAATLVAGLLVVVLSPQGALAAWSPGTGGTGTSTARNLGVPTSVAAAATGASSIHISWAAPGGASPTPTQYIVRRTAPTTTIVCSVGGGVFACDDTGLTAGTTYTYSVESRIGTNWSSGPSGSVSATTTAPGPFLVSAPGTKTAGTAFNATITATTNGVITDTTYTGVKTITFSGPSASPSGTSPTYPATVTFTAGVGTANIRLYAAETTTLAATDGTRSGSTSVTVVAGTATQLRYTTSTPSCATGTVAVGNGGSFTSRVTQYDAYLNPKNQTGSARIITLSRSPSQGTLSPGSVPISVGNSQSSTSFTFTIPTGNPPAITVRAASAGLTSANCIVTKN